MGNVVLTRRGGTGSEILNGKIEKMFAYSGEIEPNTFIRVAEGKPTKKIIPYDKTLSNAKSYNVLSTHKLDGNRALYFYSPMSSNYMFAVVVKNVNGEPVIGTSVQMSTSGITIINPLTISNGNVLCIYGYTYAYFRVLSISDTTITMGDEVSFVNDKANYLPLNTRHAFEIEANKVLLTHNWQIGSQYVSNCGACVLTVEGLTVTQGTDIQIDSDQYSSRHTAIKISDNKALVVFGDSYHILHAIVLSVSGTTISKGTAVTVASVESYTESYCSYMLSLTRLSENEDVFMVTHSRAGSYYLYAATLAILDTAISVGTDIQLTTTGLTDNISYLYPFKIAENTFAITAYYNNKLYANVIEFVSPNFFTSYSTDWFTFSDFSKSDPGLNLTPSIGSSNSRPLLISENTIANFLAKYFTSSPYEGYYIVVFSEIDIVNKTISFKYHRLEEPVAYEGITYLISGCELIDKDMFFIGFIARNTYASSGKYQYDYYASFLSSEQLLGRFAKNSVESGIIDGVSKNLLVKESKEDVWVLNK